MPKSPNFSLTISHPSSASVTAILASLSHLSLRRRRCCPRVSVAIFLFPLLHLKYGELMSLLCCSAVAIAGCC
ncbi:hypothetical protein BVRB_5g115100 [Beta vulgaris subsp. vulgaris]|nr:hypothetical protein BVRB_5g115100 [Beta vulgaris subsp. vulgaris]